MAEESDALLGIGKKALDVAKDAFFPPEFKELLNDRVWYWRFKQTHRILDRATEYVEKRKRAGKPTPLPPQLAVRFVEHASMEDDPDMQELWAKLLANALDPSTALNVSKVHMSILSEMSPLDAKVLAYFPTQGWRQHPQVAATTGDRRVLDCATIAEALGEDKERLAVSIGNLWRLGCLLQEPTWKSGVGPSTADNSAFRPSPLGTSLLRAVSDPTKQPGHPKPPEPPSEAKS